jgi:hemoglobin/transferrin/lactoferrin receptor protein
LDETGIFTRSDRAHIKVSHFITYGEDFIDQEVNQPTPGVDCTPGIPGDCDGTTRAVNIADARLSGTEVEAGYENRRVRVDLTFSTLDGENRDTGDKLGILTPPQVNLDTAVKLPEVDSTVGTRLRAADDFEKVNDPANERDGYVVNDLYATWAPQDGPLSGVRLDLGVDNVFDTNYSRVFTGAPEPGRNFKVALSYGMNF